MSQFKQFRQANRENFHRIWEAAEEGRALTVEEKRFAGAIQAHLEYHNTWEFSDVVEAAPYEVDGVNPLLHIAAHAMIAAQVDAVDPPEIAPALERLQEGGTDCHRAIHGFLGRRAGLVLLILDRFRDSFLSIGRLQFLSY